MLRKKFMGVGSLTEENIRCIYGFPINLCRSMLFRRNFKYIVNSLYRSPIISINKNKILNINNLIEKGSAHGKKLELNLPVRGQRSHKNGKTRRINHII